MRFICRNCGSTISEPVVVLEDERLLISSDEVDRLPSGYAYEETVFTDDNSRKWCINLADAMHMRHTDDHCRLNGCCGLDGLDGPNLVCETCSEAVATEKSDCWMPHFITFESDKTRIVE
jgi:hypothetical protein